MQLIDDLDGGTSSDVTTVQFGLDGVTYEIDLAESNADRLRDIFADYVTHGRRTGGRIRRGAAPANGKDAGKIREWAQANGVELAARGRIPAHVSAQYREAQEKPRVAAKKAGRRRS